MFLAAAMPLEDLARFWDIAVFSLLAEDLCDDPAHLLGVRVVDKVFNLFCMFRLGRSPRCDLCSQLFDEDII